MGAPTETPDYKPLLFINEYPPSSSAGAPVIARQLLRYYDPEKLDLLCCETFHNSDPKVAATFLPSRHKWIPTFKKDTRRPRRFWVPIEATVDSYRVGKIVAEGRKIIAERGVKALFTMPYGCEFMVAAYQLHKETGIPLYVFETDYLPATARSSRTRRLINEFYDPMLKSAAKVWCTSPAMVRFLRDEHGVDGEFLFHFVDVSQYQAALDAAPALPTDRISIVYTGSINTMFWETMKPFCDWLNAGLTIVGNDGFPRPVEMTIYSGISPDAALLGPKVKWGGWVPLEEIPNRLAQGHLTAILVSFSRDANLEKLIRTSLYTKTVDYLAAGRPTLVVSPEYSGEVDYFGDVTTVVPTLDKEKIVAAIRKMTDDAEYSRVMREKGWRLVRERHSLEALHETFLSHFLTEKLARIPAEKAVVSA